MCPSGDPPKATCVDEAYEDLDRCRTVDSRDGGNLDTRFLSITFYMHHKRGWRCARFRLDSPDTSYD